MNNNCDNCMYEGLHAPQCKNCITSLYDGRNITTPTNWKEKENNKDMVNHPSHYAEGRKYEPIKVIQDWDLDFCLGNTVKYISRAGRKTSASISNDDKMLEDLKKAKFYLDYKIQELEVKNVIGQK